MSCPPTETEALPSRFSIFDRIDEDWLNSQDLQMFPTWNAHPLYGQFGRRLYRELNHKSSRFMPSSFAILHDGIPQLLGFSTTGGTQLSFYDLPMLLAPRAAMAKKRGKSVYAECFRHLRELAQKSGASTARILGGTNDGPLTAPDLACLNQAAQPNAQINAIVDLTRDSADIRKDLRSSYRSLVNWGSRVLDMQYVNAANTDAALFEQYSAFHTRFAGGTAREKRYWDVFWSEIVNGTAELSLGFMEDGSLVSGTIVTDGMTTSYYTSGVYDREKFDKPLGHFPVFDSMMRAKERGMSTFDLGQIHAKGSEVSEKEHQIGFFKKGFTSDFQLRFIWTVTF